VAVVTVLPVTVLPVTVLPLGDDIAQRRLRAGF